MMRELLVREQGEGVEKIGEKGKAENTEINRLLKPKIKSNAVNIFFHNMLNEHEIEAENSRACVWFLAGGCHYAAVRGTIRHAE